MADTARGLTDGLVSKGQGIIDTLFPPEKRSHWMEKLKAFATSNPKLTAFFLANLALSGGPLALFVIFTVTVFVFSLVAALLIGLVAALLFSGFMVLVALFIVLPTLFMTTLTATFLFLWGLGGYYIVRWFNRVEGPGAEGQGIGDKLNSVTGGRLTWLTSATRDAHKAEHAGEEREKEPLLSDSENGMSSKKFSNAGGVAHTKATAKSTAPDSSPAG